MQVILTKKNKKPISIAIPAPGMEGTVGVVMHKGETHVTLETDNVHALIQKHFPAMTGKGRKTRTT